MQAIQCLLHEYSDRRRAIATSEAIPPPMPMASNNTAEAEGAKGGNSVAAVNHCGSDWSDIMFFFNVMRDRIKVSE